MLTEYYAHETFTANERFLWNALKFGTTGEVDSKEGEAQHEGLELAPPNCSEVGAPQGELNGAVGEALILQPLQQRPRPRLIFDIVFDDPFLD